MFFPFNTNQSNNALRAALFSFEFNAHMYLTTDFKIDQKEVNLLAEESNATWWNKNRGKLLKKLLFYREEPIYDNSKNMSLYVNFIKNMKKNKNIKTFAEHLAKRHGKTGTKTRTNFEIKAKCFMIRELILSLQPNFKQPKIY